MKKQRNKRLSHPILFFFLKLIVKPIAFLKWGYRNKSKYKISRHEKVLIVSNHQTDFDPLLIHLSFNKLVRCLATDNIFAGKFTARLLRMLGAIPKRKGIVDLKSNMEMLAASKIGDSILFFPEGNRSYADFQYYISDRIGRLVKSFGCTLVIFNIHGGFGTHPRIGNKPRKGKFYGEITRVLQYEEYKNMSDKELSDIVINGVKVIDSDSKELYKSNKRAEYFERMFFVCPKCQSTNTIYSKGNYLRCHDCDLEVEYGEDLHLHSKDPSFTYTRLVDWYDYQREYMLRHDFSKDEVVFIDNNVKLKLSNPFQKVYVFEKKSKMILTNKELIFDHHRYKLKDIVIASPVSGRKLCFTIGDNNYVVRGDKRFNALKYVFAFHKLDTAMKANNFDEYYRLEN